MSALEPFFHVIGAGRSGTSLLSCLIDAHSLCCVDPERYSPLLMENVGASDREGVGIALRMDNYLNACRARASEFPGKYWGHKATVEQICGLRHFLANIEGWNRIQAEAFIERVASVSTVFVVRDGRACISSKLTRTDQSLE